MFIHKLPDKYRSRSVHEWSGLTNNLMNELFTIFSFFQFPRKFVLSPRLSLIMIVNYFSIALCFGFCNYMLHHPVGCWAASRVREMFINHRAHPYFDNNQFVIFHPFSSTRKRSVQQAYQLTTHVFLSTNPIAYVAAATRQQRDQQQQ